jgi:hypothetical protein
MSRRWKIPPQTTTTYFAGAGAVPVVAGAGAAVSVAGAGAGAGAGFASSLAGAGACSEGPQATKEKAAKNEIATNKTKSFFIMFTSFLLSIFNFNFALAHIFYAYTTI